MASEYAISKRCDPVVGLKIHFRTACRVDAYSKVMLELLMEVRPIAVFIQHIGSRAQ